ncbi:MAG: transcriptional repressor LexA [Oculatellaceae cyanobacterium bins.114]|nr:transcriptional repressor LexA [Oculatellaceae cyanobacterium bins.114]
MKSLTFAQQRLFDWIEDYISRCHHSPSMRQMAAALNYKSLSPIQLHLKQLRQKGYIDWDEGQSRSYRVLSPKQFRVPILGAIAAHSLVETFSDTDVEWIEVPGLSEILKQTNRRNDYFALRVRGDSMIGALIDHGDVVVMQPPQDARTIRDKTIVAARVEGKTTLKHFYRDGGTILLQPANPAYPVTHVDASEVDIQGIYVGLVRGLIS